MTLRIFSNGGGVQSMAALILSARGEIDFPVHVFSNVGADSENPATLDYIERYTKPYAAAHGIEFITTERRRRSGEAVTIMGVLTGERSKRSIDIPIWMAGGAPGMRNCTREFKIKVLSRFVRARGATKDAPATVGLGISLDEFQRMRTDSGEPLQVLEYPLIDLRLTRDKCMTIIERAGLPIPPKSSCFFCPFHRPSTWMRMRIEEPELFEQAAELEAHINRTRAARGRDAAYLTSRGRPLREAFGEQSMMNFDEEVDGCEAGYCMT